MDGLKWLVWRCDKAPDEKAVREAVENFEKKFDRKPNRALLPRQADEQARKAAKELVWEVKEASNILGKDIWLARETEI